MVLAEGCEQSAGVADVLRCLTAYRFDTSSELRFQDGIASALRDVSIRYRREVALAPKDRIDFLIGSVGLEVKVDGTEMDVLRQLMRYAQSDQVSALVLVTNRSKHSQMPDSLQGKPLSVYLQGGLS